jgi:hypothetical protein
MSERQAPTGLSRCRGLTGNRHWRSERK